MANPSNLKANSKPLQIALGTDNFRKMATEYDVFVDKSGFVKEVIESSEEAILITHPRRWGKTLNLDMLKVFFEPERNPECTGAWYYNPFRKAICNDEVFKNLAIYSAKDNKGNNIVSTYQGKSPVIFFSLKDVMGQSTQEIESKLKTVIKDLYKEHRYLKDSAKLHADEKSDFQKYIDQNYQGISIENGIKFLSEVLHKHYGQRVYILVDEYDKPVNYLLEQYLGKEINEEEKKLLSDTTKLITNTVCSSVSKTNPSLKKLILTGIFDTLKKESGSGCNNVSVYGISDIRFSKYFGFSKEEVEALVTKFPFDNSPEILDKITDWYNGYTVPVSTSQNMQVYTPWAVMKYLHTAYVEGDFQPKNYWTQSGASTILQNLLTKEACVKSVLSQKLLSIAEQNSAKLQFDQQISLFKYDWFANIDNEKFFSYLLVNSGYFAVRKEGNDYIFSIPNSELRQEFADIIPKENEKCQVILYNLQKVSQLKVVEMIKKHDVEGIQKELSESHIKCDDYSMNFNFFHLSAIFGNQLVFSAFLNSRCAEYLDFANDKATSLKPIDYAFLSNNTDVITIIKSHYQNNIDTLVKIPGWGETLICFPYKSTSGSGLIAGTFDLAKDIILGPAGAVFKAIGYIGTALFGGHIGDSLEEKCKQYSEYKDIDIAVSPKKFDSLKQFEKYIYEHERAYVVINDNCKQPQEKLTELSYPIFENSFYSDEMLKFVLCESNIEKSEL